MIVIGTGTLICIVVILVLHEHGKASRATAEQRAIREHNERVMRELAERKHPRIVEWEQAMEEEDVERELYYQRHPEKRRAKKQAPKHPGYKF